MYFSISHAALRHAPFMMFSGALLVLPADELDFPHHTTGPLPSESEAQSLPLGRIGG